MSACGSRRGIGLNDGAYDKLIAKLADPAFPLDLLPPYKSSSDAGFARYRSELEANYPAWLTPAQTVGIEGKSATSRDRARGFESMARRRPRFRT